MVMVGGEGDGPALHQCLRLLHAVSQAFVDQPTHYRSPQRAAHAVPGDRGTGVENGGRRHSRDGFTSSRHPNEDRLRGENTIEGFLICFGYFFI